MKKRCMLGIAVLAVFIIFTVSVVKVDVQPIGREGTDVGMASVNDAFRTFTGEHRTLYQMTEVLGYAAFAVIAAFGLLGVCQLIRRKSLLKVDRDILLLGVFYVIVLGLYVLFDKVVLNYRPPFSWEDGPEASYPSSHTLLVLFVMSTAVMQIVRRVKNASGKWLAVTVCIILALAVVIGRAVCGVHWLTDIVGSIILSFGLAELYCGLAWTAPANAPAKDTEAK